MPSSLFALAVCSLGAHSYGDIVVAWGSDSYGQLGDGVSDGNRATAAPVLNIGPIARQGEGPGGLSLFSAGSYNAVAVRGGAAYRWGIVPVDDETYVDSPIPAVITGLESGVTLVAAVRDYYATLAVKDGSLYIYYPGSPVRPVPGLSSGGITAIEAGTTVLIIRNGALWTMGSNQYGMLGDGSSANGRNEAAQVPGFESGVTDVAIGDWNCALLKNGTVYTWGSNYGAALGMGLTDSGLQRNTPGPVVGLPGGVTAIAAGNHFNLAVHNGFVYSWGWNSSQQLGHYPGNTAIATQVPGLSGIVDVAAHGYSSFALAADGTLWSWGQNSNGNLGNTSFVVGILRRVTPPTGYMFTGIRAGNAFTMATIAPACAADFGSVGGVPVPDGRLDNNDFITFIDAFFGHDPLADIGAAGATSSPDNTFDNNDFIVFIERFFGGC